MGVKIVGLVVLALGLLGGCRPSDDQVRGELRGQMLQRCKADIAPRAAALPGFDTDAYCACVTEMAIGRRSVDELKAMFEDRARVTEQGRQAASQCLAQQAVGEGAGAGGPPANSRESDPPEPKEKAAGTDRPPAAPRPARRGRAALEAPQADPDPVDEGSEADPDE